MLCHTCGKDIVPIIRWKPMQTPESKAHLGAYCPTCLRWIKWVPQTDFWKDQANEEPRLL